MPIITRFYGIIIKMFFLQKEHQPPHFHAIYGEHNAVYNIKTLEMIEGDLPKTASKLVTKWAKMHQDELMEIWETQKFKKIEGLE